MLQLAMQCGRERAGIDPIAHQPPQKGGCQRAISIIHPRVLQGPGIASVARVSSLPSPVSTTVTRFRASVLRSTATHWKATRSVHLHARSVAEEFRRILPGSSGLHGG